jgi:predicted nucleic acid-binding protein
MYKLITGFSIVMANETHYKLAAQTANKCRKNGVATTATDCLIAAMAISYSAQLLNLLGERYVHLYANSG